MNSMVMFPSVMLDYQRVQYRVPDGSRERHASPGRPESLEDMMSAWKIPYARRSASALAKTRRKNDVSKPAFIVTNYVVKTCYDLWPSAEKNAMLSSVLGDPLFILRSAAAPIFLGTVLRVFHFGAKRHPETTSKTTSKSCVWKLKTETSCKRLR